MAAITDSQLVLHLDSFITGHLQNAGNSAIDDFHTVLRERAIDRFNLAGAEGAGVTGLTAILCSAIAASVTAVAAAIAVPIGVIIHQNNQSAVERNIDQLKTMWRSWWSSYCSSWRTTVLRQAGQFASGTRRRDPSQMDTDHFPALERGFLEYAGAPCQAYIYVRVWNHIAYHWDSAIAQEGRRSGRGPQGVIMPCRTLGRRDAYGASLPSATDAEAHRAAHTATMPSDLNRMEIRNLGLSF